MGTRAPDCLPPEKTPSILFFPGTFVQNSLTGSKHVATWTTPCPGPCSLSGDMWVTQLRTLRCQGKAAAVSQESANPYCLPTIVPVTPIETHSTAKAGEVGMDSSGESPCKITFLVISKHSRKAFICFSFFLLSPDSVTITHKDVQWVGAWWLGYLIAGVISVLAGIPFWFLPKHLPRPESRKDSSTSSEHSKFITEDNKDQHKSYQQQVKIAEMAKGKSPEFLSWPLSLSLTSFYTLKLHTFWGHILMASELLFSLRCHSPPN